SLPCPQGLGGRSPVPLSVAVEAHGGEAARHLLSGAVGGGVVGHDDLAIQGGACLNARFDRLAECLALVVAGNDDAGTHEWLPLKKPQLVNSPLPWGEGTAKPG